MLIKIFITNYNSINNLFSTLVLEYYNKIIKINKNKNREKIIKMKKKKVAVVSISIQLILLQNSLVESKLTFSSL